MTDHFVRPDVKAFLDRSGQVLSRVRDELPAAV